jgi:hypothetical protein
MCFDSCIRASSDTQGWLTCNLIEMLKGLHWSCLTWRDWKLFSQLKFPCDEVKTNELCAKFQIIRSLNFSRIVIQIVQSDPDFKSVATLFIQIWLKKANTYNFQFISICAYLSVVSALAHLCKKFKCYVFRLWDL